MNQSSDEWVWSRLDDGSDTEMERSMEPGLVPGQGQRLAGERELERGIAQALASGSQCPDALWESIQQRMRGRERRSQGVFRRIGPALLAASILMTLSSGATAFLLLHRQRDVFFAQEKSPPSFASGETSAKERDYPLEQAALAEKQREAMLAEAMAEVEKARAERDLAMTERDEARAKLQELENDVRVARDETDTLRADLTSVQASHATLRGEVDELRRIAGLLGAENISAGFTHSTAASGVLQEAALSMPLPESAASTLTADEEP
ncbi:MAG TPA: hypothetical protein PLO62_09475 [Candidatus Hydrogenedentes bacterium]|nr:hypothetical protein [Candidatus Hydrogenedentota bacterium]HOS02183.1 hypothetical protein [Candidatus Hydrogenedentota bacterium]